MGGEGTEKQLYNAARIGDLTTFRQLLQIHPHLVDVVSFSLLHIAIRQGQESIVEEVLNINRELALDLDSKNSSSLHIAAARGNTEMVKRVLSIAPEMCWWRDCHDMNPIHVAAMKGNEDALKEMLQHDFFPARERLHHGRTVLHLCVQHRQLGTLKVLVEELGVLVRAKDDDGETILHLAVRSNQIEMIQYLVQSNKIEYLTKNSIGRTELDILDENSREVMHRKIIKRMLDTFSRRSRIQEMIPTFKDTTLVVLVLVTAMAFQAIVSPPGGVWQDSQEVSQHIAGKSVMATTHPKPYRNFVHANSIAFFLSLLTIFLITSGLTNRSSIFMSLAMYTMAMSMASIAASYIYSLSMINPTDHHIVGYILPSIVLIIFLFLLIIFSVVDRLATCFERKKRHRIDLTTLHQDTTNPGRELGAASYLLSQAQLPNSPSPDTGRTVQAA